MNHPHTALTQVKALHEMFGVQLYKNNAQAPFAYSK